MKKQMLSFFNYEYLDNKLHLNDNSQINNLKINSLNLLMVLLQLMIL